MNKIEILKDNALGLGTVKWVPVGAEILRLIGWNVICIEMTKKDDGWESSASQVLIKEINDFDPLTKTYKITYIGEDKKVYEERIFPQGITFCDPKRCSTIHRFVPISLHEKMMEDEAFYGYLKQQFDSISGILGKEIKDYLQSDLVEERNLGLLIDTDRIPNALAVGIIYLRINEIKALSSLSNAVTFGAVDSDGNFFQVKLELEKDIQENFVIDETLVGVLKIIDLQNLHPDLG